MNQIGGSGQPPGQQPGGQTPPGQPPQGGQPPPGDCTKEINENEELKKKVANLDEEINVIRQEANQTSIVMKLYEDSFSEFEKNKVELNTIMDKMKEKLTHPAFQENMEKIKGKLEAISKSGMSKAPTGANTKTPTGATTGATTKTSPVAEPNANAKGTTNAPTGPTDANVKGSTTVANAPTDATAVDTTGANVQKEEEEDSNLNRLEFLNKLENLDKISKIMMDTDNKNTKHTGDMTDLNKEFIGKKYNEVYKALEQKFVEKLKNYLDKTIITDIDKKRNNYKYEIPSTDKKEIMNLCKYTRKFFIIVKRNLDNEHEDIKKLRPANFFVKEMLFKNKNFNTYENLKDLPLTSYTSIGSSTGSSPFYHLYDFFKLFSNKTRTPLTFIDRQSSLDKFIERLEEHKNILIIQNIHNDSINHFTDGFISSIDNLKNIKEEDLEKKKKKLF